MPTTPSTASLPPSTTRSTALRRLVAFIAVSSLLITQTTSLAGPHDEGLAAGRAANPVIRGGITTPGASAAVPGFTSSPGERSFYRQPNLAAQGNSLLAACASTPQDPVCQALLGAQASANTARPGLAVDDPSVAAARAINRSPSSQLGDLSAYYSGCSTSATALPARVEPRSCLRSSEPGSLRCSRQLSVAVTRSSSCTPGDWFAHAGSGSAGLDAQCLPDRPLTAQRFRVTQGGSPLAFFDVDLTRPTPFTALVAVLGSSLSAIDGQPIREGVWVSDSACSGPVCTLTAQIAPERRETCIGGNESVLSCTSVEPFLPTYSACPAGTQGGDLIQAMTCAGDNGCSSTRLDPQRCFAPSSGWTPYTGADTSGSLASLYWTPASSRSVVGWAVNPLFGPIPTLQLSYEAARSTVTETDRWDDQCPNLAAGGRCTASATSAEVCTHGPATQLIDGAPVTRDCWEYSRSLTCAGWVPADPCAELVAAGCTPQDSSCLHSDPATGACRMVEERFSCPRPAETVTSASGCPTQTFCLNGNCFDTAAPADADFARSITMLEAGRQAGVYLDTDRMEVFRGEGNRCRDRLFTNCCSADTRGGSMHNLAVLGMGSRLVYDLLMNPGNQRFVQQGLQALLMGQGFVGSFSSYGITVAVNGAALPAGSVALYSGESVVVAFDPWTLAVAAVFYAALSLTSCNEDEARLAMKEGAGLCHSVGDWCSTCLRVLGSCVSCTERTTSKCCFNSRLARIINEQGRQQLGKGWGDERSPDCSGFTVAQLQALDFAAMDLSEFYASLVPTLPDAAALQNRVGSRAPSCYYGQGSCP